VATFFDIQGFGALSEWNGQFSSASAAAAFQSIASTGANSIELSPRIWTQTGTSSSVFADPAKTESDASLAASIETAHADGLSVVLKPEITGLDGTSSGSLHPSDVAAFFASYKSEIVHLATLAQQNGVETLALGNEMSSLSGVAYLPYWSDIISAVRAVYHGDLTYAAATDEASKVSFWGELDTIGVNTYPPLSASTSPTVADLVNAWNQVPTNPYYAAAFDYKSPVDFLHSLAEQYGKPVLMTEVGYRSIDGTAISPGSWNTTGTADVTDQADAFNAFFQVWSEASGSWFKGAEIWQWDLSNTYSPTGYSPMGKPALDVISHYFHDNPGATSAAPIIINGSAIADVIDVGRGDKIISGGLGDDVIRVRDGTNVIYAGPQTLASLQSTTITLTGYGSVVSGIGAQVQVLVNGQAVGAVMEFKPASDPSGYQTFTVTFANPASVTSIDLNLINAASGRALHLKDFAINGVDITPDETTNGSSPGTFDLYVRTIHFDASTHQDVVYGATSANDTVIGGSGNDTIYVGAGSNTIDGGGGTNTAIYAGDMANYTVAQDGSTFTVTKHASGNADHLSNIQFLEFADQTITLNPNAGTSVYGIDPLPAGSHDVYLGGIAGKSYASEHDVIDASGHTALLERFYADGALALMQTINADGSVTLSDYDASGHRTDTMTRHADGSFDQLTFDGAGNTINETIRHADMTRGVFIYDITGKSYASEHDEINAAGHTALIERYFADGSLALTQTLNADSSVTLTDYNTSGYRTDTMTRHADGSFDQLTFDADGNTTSETIRNADMTRDVFTFGITGKAYSEEHDVISAAGHKLESIFANNDGSHSTTAYASGLTLDVLAGANTFNSAGGETFVFGANSGSAVINNFHAGEGLGHDALVLYAGPAGDTSSITSTTSASGIVLNLSNGNTITLTNVTVPLTSHDLVIV